MAGVWKYIDPDQTTTVPTMPAYPRLANFTVVLTAPTQTAPGTRGPATRFGQLSEEQKEENNYSLNDNESPINHDIVPNGENGSDGYTDYE